MKKKYQVFVSSTYEDLKNERQAVISCLLDMNCIPVGMEQFPASDLSQWDYIKKMIDMSDYYILLVAGKYGSIDPEEGISYTEKEYNYAVKNNIPIIAFLVKDVEALPVAKVGKTDQERENVECFRNKVMNSKRMVDFYNDEKELKYAIATAIPKLIEDCPRPGWVRADQAEKAIEAASDESGFAEIKKQLDDLQIAILDKVEQTRLQWEPISESEIMDMFDEKTDMFHNGLPSLSNKSKTLLHEVSQDSVGQILWIGSLAGIEVYTNNKTLNDSKTGKEIAEWEAAIKELIQLDLIKEIGNRGQIYQMTKKGYDLVEKLNDNMNI